MSDLRMEICWDGWEAMDDENVGFGMSAGRAWNVDILVLQTARVQKGVGGKIGICR